MVIRPTPHIPGHLRQVFACDQPHQHWQTKLCNSWKNLNINQKFYNRKSNVCIKLLNELSDNNELLCNITSAAQRPFEQRYRCFVVLIVLQASYNTTFKHKCVISWKEKQQILQSDATSSANCVEWRKQQKTEKDVINLLRGRRKNRHCMLDTITLPSTATSCHVVSPSSLHDGWLHE